MKFLRDILPVRVGLLCSVLTIAAPPVAVQAQSTSGVDSTPPEITFTSWTGPYMRSQMLGFVRPYESRNQRARVNVEHYNGGIDEIRDQVESANVVWDVVDLTQADSLRACEGRAAGGSLGHLPARGRRRHPGQG